MIETFKATITLKSGRTREFETALTYAWNDELGMFSVQTLEKRYIYPISAVEEFVADLPSEEIKKNTKENITKDIQKEEKQETKEEKVKNTLEECGNCDACGTSEEKKEIPKNESRVRRFR